MNIICLIFGHNLYVVDDYAVKGNKIVKNDVGHRMCGRCKAVNWQEGHYPGLGIWFDKNIK